MLAKKIIHFFIFCGATLVCNLLLTHLLEVHNYQIAQNALYTYSVILLITIIIIILLQYLIKYRHVKNLIILFLTNVLILVISSFFFSQNILNIIFTFGLTLIINHNFLIAKKEIKAQIVSNFWLYIGFSLLISLIMINTEMFFISIAYLLINLHITLHLDKRVNEKAIRFDQAASSSTYTIIATTIILLLVG